MPVQPKPALLAFADVEPDVSESAWVAGGATLIGRVTIGARSSVWFTTVVRADGDRIDVGVETNLQDGVVLHADPGFPVSVGDRVSVGHRAILHGCTVDDDVLIGMGAVVLNGAHIGTGCLIAASAVVLEGTVVPPGSLVAGVPAKVRRQLTEQEVAAVRLNAASYVRLAAAYADGVTDMPPADRT
jgi:carbonic anhydrase/acetyltransferase-like protein (isoleucine patch superfamily)